MTDPDDFTSPMPLKAGMENLSDEDDDVRVPVAATSDSDMGRRTTTRRLRLPDAEPAVAASPRRRFKLPGITFRRRRDGEEDKDKLFWNAVMVLSFLSLGVLTAISFVLAQTEFFITHQVDLLGVSIDKIFSVVSEEKTTIYLHNTGHLPGKAAFNYEDHVLTIGRVKATDKEELPYYGLNIHHNGTVAFTNELRAPNIDATTVHADSLIFLDGTTMTTAADISGGLLQDGDLNFASQKGSIVAATGGKQRFLVNADGLVIVPNPDATPPDDPNKVGIVLDGRRNRVSFGDHLDIFADKSTAGLESTAAMFALAANDIALGRDGAERVRLTCLAMDKLSFGKPMRLEVVGQFAKSGPGGDVVVAGGDGAGAGGDLRLIGGHTTPGGPDASTHLGSIFINAPATTTDRTPSSSVTATTYIGSNSSTNAVVVQGSIQLNAESSHLPVQVGGNVSVRGSALTVTSTFIVLGAADASSVQVQAKRVDVVAPTVSLQGDVVQVTHADEFVVNVTSRVSATSPAIEVTAKKVSVHADEATWTTASTHLYANDSFQVTGRSIRLGAHSTTKDAPDGATSLGGMSVHVGDVELTKELHFHTTQVFAAHVNGSTLTVARATDNAVAITSASGLVVGSDGTDALRRLELCAAGDDIDIEFAYPMDTTRFLTGFVSLYVESGVHIHGKTLQLSATTLDLGSPSSAVNIQGTVTLNGKPWPAPATRRLYDDELALQARGGSATTRTKLLEAFSIEFDTVESVGGSGEPSVDDVTLTSIPVTGRFEFDLAVHGIRAEMNPLADADSLLVRCQVVRRSHDDQVDVVLEASVDVDVCPVEWRCLSDRDAIAPTLAGRSIVQFHQGGVTPTYSVLCASKMRRKRHQDTTASVIVAYDRVVLTVRQV